VEKLEKRGIIAIKLSVFTGIGRRSLRCTGASSPFPLELYLLLT